MWNCVRECEKNMCGGISGVQTVELPRAHTTLSVFNICHPKRSHSLQYEYIRIEQ